jgi:hypothetical protein
VGFSGATEIPRGHQKDFEDISSWLVVSTYPSEKYEGTSVGMVTFHSQLNGKIIKFHGSKPPTYPGW